MVRKGKVNKVEKRDMKSGYLVRGNRGKYKEKRKRGESLFTLVIISIICTLD